MSELTPETRTENFWVNEGDLEPITRKEQYIKHLYDETQVVPDHPVTREEYFINKAGEELHDVTVEQLSVTENGTYSEAGKAYSPVIVEVPDPVLKTKSITDNGTYNASEDNADGYSQVSVNVPLPQNAYLLKSVPNLPQPIASFTDGAENMPLKSLEVAIEPQQDLHGYDSPWVGGAGKNKFKTDFENTTMQGTTITKTSDGRVLTSGIPSASFDFVIGHIELPAGTYILNGCPANGGATKYRLQVTNYPISVSLGQDSGSGVSFTLDTTMEVAVRIQVYTGASASLEYKPMIRRATETDATFEPYSNICPISGWDECNVTNDAVYGGTVAWNQIIPNAKIQLTENVSEDVASNKWGSTIAYVGNAFADHVVVAICKLSNGKCSISWGANNYRFVDGDSGNTETTTTIGIYKPTQIMIGNSGEIAFRLLSGLQAGTYNATINLIDLTQLFGSTKADEIYAMEQAEVGSGVAYFKSLFYKDYYAYNSGEITNVSAVNGDTDKYHTYTIDLDGTRYGGTLDVVSGVLTVDRAYVDLGTLDYSLSSSISVFYSTITNMKAPSTSSDRKNGIISSMFPVSNSTSISASMDDKSMLRDAGAIYIRDTDYNDATVFKTAMNGVQLVYELATPLTIQLTPTAVKSLLGTNNIWADTGDITDAEYFSKEV